VKSFECSVVVVASEKGRVGWEAFPPRKLSRLPASTKTGARSVDRLAVGRRRRAQSAPYPVRRQPVQQTGSRGARSGRGWLSYVRRRRSDVARTATAVRACRGGGGVLSRRRTPGAWRSVTAPSYTGIGRWVARRTTSTRCRCSRPRSSCRRRRRRRGVAVPGARHAPPVPSRPRRTHTRCLRGWSDHQRRDPSRRRRRPRSHRRLRRPFDGATTAQRRRYERRRPTCRGRTSCRQNSVVSGHVLDVCGPKDVCLDLGVCTASCMHSRCIRHRLVQIFIIRLNKHLSNFHPTRFYRFLAGGFFSRQISWHCHH